MFYFQQSLKISYLALTGGMITRTFYSLEHLWFSCRGGQHVFCVFIKPYVTYSVVVWCRRTNVNKRRRGQDLNLKLKSLGLVFYQLNYHPLSTYTFHLTPMLTIMFSVYHTFIKVNVFNYPR
jgi:hypothetical protein